MVRKKFVRYRKKAIKPISFNLVDFFQTLGFILAVLVFAWQVYTNNIDQKYNVLIRFIDEYQRISISSNTVWLDVRKTVRSNPKTANEIPDTCGVPEYLLLRLKQPEPLYQIEIHLAETEFQRINILNEIIRLASNDNDKLTLVKSILSREISYYKFHINDMKSIRNEIIKRYDMSKIHFDFIEKSNTDDFFGKFQ